MNRPRRNTPRGRRGRQRDLTTATATTTRPTVGNRLALSLHLSSRTPVDAFVDIHRVECGNEGNEPEKTGSECLAPHQ